jgi:hypothetical protein
VRARPGGRRDHPGRAGAGRPTIAVAAIAVALAATACASGRSRAASTRHPTTTTTFHRSTTTSSTVPPADPPSSTVLVPTLSGPMTGGRLGVPVNAMPRGWAKQYGYSEHEYFMHGDAYAAVPDGAWSFDGRWRAKFIWPRAYTTRLLVRMPTDAKKFNGVVVVEWLDESFQRDDDPVWASAGPGLMRGGFGYVAVSAQEVGIDGHAGSFGAPGALLRLDPARYHGLSHPGDGWSYDIFSQAAQALWHPVGVNALGTVRPRMLLAAGASEAASRLVTYYNAVAPRAHVYAGYYIEGRGYGAATALGWGDSSSPHAARLRTDRPEPVLTLETETDLDDLGFGYVAQPDTATLRTWEVAGTAQRDRDVVAYDAASTAVWNPAPVPRNACGSINDGQLRVVVNKALDSLVSWVDNADPPAHSPRFTAARNGVIARDFFGNAMGGIRTPAVAAPTRTVSGRLRGGFCTTLGSSKPFPAAALARLYPTHASYVLYVEIAAGNAVRDGFLLPIDAAAIIADAKAAPIPS